MKKYLIYIAITTTMLAMSGCSSDNTETGTDSTAAAGQTVLVYPGDTVTPLNAATQIEVQNIYEDGYSRVIVLSGSITVTRQ